MDEAVRPVMRRDAGIPLTGEGAARARTVDAAPGNGSIRSVLVCRPNTRLGNTVLLTPLVHELERLLPQARIDLLTAFAGTPELFSGFPQVRTLHVLPFRGPRHPLAYAAKTFATAAIPYDLVIDPEPWSWTSGFMTRLMRSKRKLGFHSPRKSRPGYLRVPVEGAPRHMGAFPVYLARRAFAGMDETQAGEDIPVLDIRLSAAEREAGRRLLAERVNLDAPVVAIAASATGAKRYPAEWWRVLAGRIRSQSPGVQIVEIRPPSGEASFPEYPGYASRSLRQVASVIGAASCFVSADSGLMHLGSASLCPTLGLFKVTDSTVYAPYGARNRAIQLSEGEPLEALLAEVARRLPPGDPGGRR